MLGRLVILHPLRMTSRFNLYCHSEERQWRRIWLRFLWDSSLRSEWQKDCHPERSEGSDCKPNELLRQRLKWLCFMSNKTVVKKLIYTTTAAILIYELQPFYIISIIFNFPFKFFTRFFKLLTPLIRLLLLLILHFKNF